MGEFFYFFFGRKKRKFQYSKRTTCTDSLRTSLDLLNEKPAARAFRVTWSGGKGHPLKEGTRMGSTSACHTWRVFIGGKGRTRSKRLKGN